MRWIDALIEVQMMRAQALVWLVKKAWQIMLCVIGALIGTVVTSSLIGLYVADNPKGFIHKNYCFNGREVVVAFGTNLNAGFKRIDVPEWGPIYFRVKMDVLVWPGGAIGFNRNNVGVCPDMANADTMYEAKKNWIETHDTEWMAYVKANPAEGKTWYGRQWKSVLRQINRQTAAN